MVEQGEACDLLFDTAAARRWRALRSRQTDRVDVAETPGAHYFVVEPDREQLLELAQLADAGEMLPEIDSIFPFAEARSAFARNAAEESTARWCCVSSSRQERKAKEFAACTWARRLSSEPVGRGSAAMLEALGFAALATQARLRVHARASRRQRDLDEVVEPRCRTRPADRADRSLSILRTVMARGPRTPLTRSGGPRRQAPSAARSRTATLNTDSTTASRQ